MAGPSPLPFHYRTLRFLPYPIQYTMYASGLPRSLAGKGVPALHQKVGPVGHERTTARGWLAKRLLISFGRRSDGVISKAG